jgi:hypothetical protein
VRILYVPALTAELLGRIAAGITPERGPKAAALAAGATERWWWHWLALGLDELERMSVYGDRAPCAEYAPHVALVHAVRGPWSNALHAETIKRFVDSPDPPTTLGATALAELAALIRQRRGQ